MVKRGLGFATGGLAVAVLCGCTGGGAGQPDDLVGRWDSERYIACSDDVVAVELDSGGATNLSGDRGTWRVEGGQLVIVEQDGTRTFRYELDGDRMRLTDARGNVQNLVRCGTETARHLEAERRRIPGPPANTSSSPLDGSEMIDNQAVAISNAAGM